MSILEMQPISENQGIEKNKYKLISVFHLLGPITLLSILKFSVKPKKRL